MAIFELGRNELKLATETTFRGEQIKERADLQRILRDQIEVVAPGTMVVAEEFGDWQDSQRRIDLLGLDGEGNLVVIELKRTEDAGHADLQALRYAAMVSTMTFDQLVQAHQRYLDAREIEEGARERLLSFLNWDEEQVEGFSPRGAPRVGVGGLLQRADYDRPMAQRP